jgi:hypothetical protein
MLGEIKSLGDIITGASKYSIPPYQRQYQWNAERWQAFVSDVSNSLTSNENDPQHWLGILLLSKDSQIALPGDSSPSNFAVIDGQQRLVTILVWIAALVHHADSIGESIEFDLQSLCHLTVQVSDQKPLEVVLKGLWQESQFESLRTSQIVQAYQYFRYLLWLGTEAIAEEYEIAIPAWKNPPEDETYISIYEKFLNTASGNKVPRGAACNSQNLLEVTLTKLSIFVLVHDAQIDEPVAAIFDTLNGMRTELEPLDHVRNSIFVRLNQIDSDDLFNNYWTQAEDGIRDVRLKGLKPGISFLYDYVISKGEKKRQGTISRPKGASHFARMTRELSGSDLSDYMKTELIPAMVSWPVVIRKRDSIKYEGSEIFLTQRTIELLDSIRDLSKNPANPLVLLYLCARVKGKISNSALESRLFLIESFLARQVLALVPLSPLRARIMDIASDLDSDTSEGKLRSVLRNQRLETDANIKSKAKKGNYGTLEPVQLGAIFRGIEKSLSGRHAMNFKIGPNDYTIEHIYPKKDEKWLVDFRSWKTDATKMRASLQLLGNLTVVSKEHNSKVGNKRLNQKQSYPSGVGRSAPLRIHDDWLNATKWTESEIQKRTEKLILAALKHWPSPK